jgi:hypothetical protein
MGSERTVAGLRTPFTAYDIFGYIAPGGILLLLAYLFEVWAHVLQSAQRATPQVAVHTPFWTSVQILWPEHVKPDLAGVAIFLTAAVAILYIAGHLVDSLASLLLDRVLISKGFGWPYLRLLKLKENRARRSPPSGPFYRGLVFWLNLIVLLCYLGLLPVTGKKPWPGSGTVIELARVLAYFVLVGLVMKVVATLPFAETGSHRRKLVRRAIRSKWLRTILRCSTVGICSVWPFLFDWLFARVVSRYLQTRQPFEPSFLQKYRHLFRTVFSMEAETADTSNFWLTGMYVIERSPRHGAIIESWHRQCHFVRNLSMALYGFFWYGFVWLLVNTGTLFSSRNDLKGLMLCNSTHRMQVLTFAPLLALLLALVMMMRFYYLFVSHYTKYIFRAFVLLAGNEARGGVEEEA